METAGRREHVILFPFMAQGHLIPYSALALELEQKTGYNITIINTPLNVETLKSYIPSSSSIRFKKIPFNSLDHGLPPNTENTNNLPLDLIYRLLEASTSLKPGFRKAVLDCILDEPCHPPLCIIADFFYGWTADIAREFDIYHSIFVGGSAYGMALYYSLWTRAPQWKVEGVEEFDNDDFPEAGKIHVTQLPAHLRAATGSDKWSVILRKRLLEWKATNSIFFNTVEEIDGVGLRYFRRKLGVPVYPVGMITFTSYKNNNARITSHDQCLEWLETQPQKSVLYICFGSQNTIKESQMMELALALEGTKRPFIWVIRPPLGVDYKSEFKADEWLPKGFEQRIQEQKMGFLLREWAPQFEILSHKSVGGFVSHCGWNSVLEAINHEVPVLGWPMSVEQFFNVKFLVEVGVCVEVGRGHHHDVKKEEIAEKVEMVMGENDGAKRIRNRSFEVSQMFKDARKDEMGYKGSSVRAMEEFFLAAVSNRSLNFKDNKKPEFVQILK